MKNTVILTEFGSETSCSDFISVFDIDPTSAQYGKKTVILNNLCGAHNSRLNQAESLLYYVEVSTHTLSAIRIDVSKLPQP